MSLFGFICFAVVAIPTIYTIVKNIFTQKKDPSRKHDWINKNINKNKDG